MKRLGALLVALALFPVPAFAGPFTALYVVGDSLSDQGNAFSLTSGFPVAPYAHRASNGPVAVEQLASRLGLPLGASTNGGNNHAVVGAMTGAENLAALLYGQPGLSGQGMLAQVGEIVGAGPLVDPSGSLFVVWGGANDLFFDPSAGGVSTALGNIAGAISTLYGAGARHFLVPNLPDLSLTPYGLSLSAGDQAGLRALTMGFNGGLSFTLGALGALPAMDITAFDTFALMNAIVATPGAYGFNNVTTACIPGNLAAPGPVCLSPDTTLFWDSVHPTAAGHAVLGDAFSTAVGQPVPEPHTMVLVGAGLFTLALSRRKS